MVDEDGTAGRERMRLLAAQEELVARGLIEPLAWDDRRQLRAWQDMDLAIMIEGCFGAAVDPRHFGEPEREAWLARLADVYGPPEFSGESRRRPFWLLRDGRRAGTLCLGHATVGASLVPVTGLYLLPEHRGADVAGRALRAFHEAAGRAGCAGVRLETYWVWPSIVRYYVRRGFWLSGWKRDLTLIWRRDLPPYEMDFGDTAARFRVQRGGAWVEVRRARKAGGRGDLLGLEPAARGAGGAEDLADATFALGLALAGWPLHESESQRAQHRPGADRRPGGLAHRIEVWEAVARHRGWLVNTPRVPGIAYRGYDQLFSAE